MIDNLAVIEESHLNDPDGNVERRLAMCSRNDVLQIKELEDILATPSPKPSAIVRNWPDAMWGRRAMKTRAISGDITYCALGILYESGSGVWGDPTRIREDGTCTWDFGPETIRRALDLPMHVVTELVILNDKDGKEAAANYLASLGL